MTAYTKNDFIAGGDLSGSTTSQKVISLTGTGGVVSVPNGTSLSQLSGSLQKTSAGLSYLVGTGAVFITSQSNGQIIISGSGGGSGTWTAGGDLVGTLSSQQVVSLTGAGGVVTGPAAAISIGIAPALSGVLRLPNFTSVNFRNALNNADLVGISLGPTNQLQVGDSSNAGFVFTGGGASAMRTPTFAIQPTAGNVNAWFFNGLAIGSNTSLTSDTSMTSVTISQADVTTPSATGASTTIQAQNSTGATSVGGPLILQGGSGTLTSGSVRFKIGPSTVGQLAGNTLDFIQIGVNPASSGSLRLGNNSFIVGKRPGGTDGAILGIGVDDILHVGSTAATAQVNLDSAGNIVLNGTTNHICGSSTIFRDAGIGAVSSTLTMASAGLNSWVFVNTVTSVTMSQADNVTASSTGSNYVIQAQNATGTTSVGGNLFLKAGRGTSFSGSVKMHVGDVVVASLGAVAADFIALGASGSSVAQTGNIRWGTAGSIVSRFSTFGADCNVLNMDGANNLNLGDDSKVGSISIHTTQGTNFYVSAAVVGQWQTVGIAMNGAAQTFSFSANNATSKFYQLDTAVASATGSNVTVQAQNSTGTTSQGGNLILSGGIGTFTAGRVIIPAGLNFKITNITGSYNIDQNGSVDYILFCSGSTGALTCSMPVPTSGRTVIIKDTSGNASGQNIVMKPFASEKIEGIAGTFTISGNWTTHVFTADGTNWFLTS